MDGSGGARARFRDKFAGLQFRNIGPFRGGRVTAVAGVPGQPLTFYFGGTGGGVWKTTDGGASWTGLRQVLQDRLGGRARGGGLRSERGLRGDGRRLHPRQRVGGRRRLEVDGRGKDVDLRGSERDTADSARARAPEEPGPRLRRSARARVRTEPRARHLPVAGRREDLEEGPLRRRQDGRVRSRHGPHEPARALRGLLAGRADAVEPRERRAGQRPLQDDGRRRHVEEARGRAARRIVGRVGVAVSPARPNASGRSSRPRRAASSARTTAARRGRRRTPRTSSGSGPGTTRTSTRTRRTPTPCTCSTSASSGRATGERRSIPSARRTATTTTSGSTRRAGPHDRGNDGGATVTFNGGRSWSSL